MKLERKILIGFAIGLAAGLLSRVSGFAWLQATLIAIEPVGTIFIRLITMVVVPLVIASVFVGVASLGNMESLGRVGTRTLCYFFGTTLAASIVGLVVALLTHVGEGATFASAPMALAAPSLQQTLIEMVPQNPFAEAATGGGQLLPLIIAVCIFGAAATALAPEPRRTIVQFFDAVNKMAMIVVGWLMRAAPGAVAVLIAAAIAKFGLAVLHQLLVFALVAVLALALHVTVVLMPALRFGARIGIRKFFGSVSDALLLAFSTASSNAALPVSMTAARDKLGVPEDIVNFVLPPGASIDKNGSAAYKAVTVMFIAHMYGMTIGAGAMITLVLVASIAAFAGAGVPGSSLVTTLIVLNAVGLGPQAAAGIALVAAIDRPLDMCRTTVNTIGNLVGAAWIGRAEPATIAT